MYKEAAFLSSYLLPSTGIRYRLMELISACARLYKYVDRILVTAATLPYMYIVVISLMHPLLVGYVLYKKAESYMQGGRICTEPIII